MHQAPSDVMTTEPIVRELRRLAADLVYSSEGDHPFETLHVRDPHPGQPLSVERMLTLLKVGADARYQVVTLERVLGRHTVFTDSADVETQRIRPRYEALRRYLEHELRNTMALRTGNPPVVDVWLVGRLPNGDIAGYHTVAIET